MENGRNNDDGISGRQLRELLRSLPAAHAPEDLELNLLYRINENEIYPHRNRLRRFPHMGSRAAASENVTPTRGIDRVRGLAAAALAAFVVVGGWTFFSHGNPAQTSAAQNPQSVSAPPAVYYSPAPSVDNGISVQPSPEVSSAERSEDKPHILSPIELEWEETEKDRTTKGTGAAENRQTTTFGPTAASAQQGKGTAKNVTPAKAASSTNVPPADSVAAAPSVIDTGNIGTGGDPPDDLQSE